MYNAYNLSTKYNLRICLDSTTVGVGAIPSVFPNVWRPVQAVTSMCDASVQALGTKSPETKAGLLNAH